MKNSIKKLLSLLLVLSMVLMMFPVSAQAAEGDVKITILGTSDLHSNVWGFSYEDSKETTNNGMARLYTYIQGARAENPNTILIDAGDLIQGTIMSDDIYNKTPDSTHPVIEAMNYMKYDAMTLGNHEFNWGLDTMKKILNQAKFPVLAANVTDSNKKAVTNTEAGWTIIEKGGVKVAVIGVVTPDVPIWDGGKPGIDNSIFEAANVAVKRAIAEIGNKADVIVVSAHMGLYAEFDEENGSDSAQKILDDNPEIDVLQVAHNHVVVNEKKGNVVIGGARNGGRDIVRFDITVNAKKEIVDSSVSVVDMADVEPSSEIRNIELVKEAHQKTIDFIKGGTGENGEEAVALGQTTAAFQPLNEINGLPEGKLRDTAVMDLINMLQLKASGADVSAAALFKDTSNLPAGDINYGNIFDIYKFDNTLYRVTVTGKELKNYMEWSAECYNQWVEGDINISFDPEYPGYLYDMFAGVDYEIDLSQPKGQRIKNVMFKGAALKDDQTLTLAVNNYRYSSALKAKGLVEGKKEWESPNSIRDMIVAHFASNSPVTPSVDNNWKIVGVDLQEKNPDRAKLIALINAGIIETPYAKSININDPAIKAILANKDYDVYGKNVVGKVTEISKYGNITLDIKPQALYDAGFELGDILNVTVGNNRLEIPFCTSYSDVDTKNLVIRHDKENDIIIVAINMGNFAKTYSSAVGDQVKFEMKEKQGYLTEYMIKQLVRTNERNDYASDDVFANFRVISTTGMKSNILYRSSSPVNNEIGRASYANDLAKAAGIATVINLADSKEMIDGYRKDKDFKSEYYASLYDAGNVVALNMGVDLSDKEFGSKLAEGLKFMLTKEGPYLVHCNEGKDRAGFVSAVLEALAGASMDEIVADYMVTYENYYGVKKDSEQYKSIAESNIITSMTMIVAGLEKGADITNVNMQDAAKKYLISIGMTEVEVNALIAKISSGEQNTMKFSDVKPGDWFYNSVKYVFDNKIMTGTSDTTFAPRSKVTRATVATIIWRLAGEEKVEGEMKFNDVEANMWYSEAIKWAAAKEIVNGYGDGRFLPNKEVTREELATMLYRYAKTKGQGFTGTWMFLMDVNDLADISEYASEAVHWMYMKGVMTGKEGKMIDPRGTATRAELATMLARYMQLKEE